jgi:hypothetical protein
MSPNLSSDVPPSIALVLRSKPPQLFTPDPEMFPQLNGLKLEANDEFIYVFDIDVVPATDKPDHSKVSVFITDTFIGEEVNPEKKHHQAYTLMGEKKPVVVYKRKYRKAEDRIQPSQPNSQRNSASYATSPATP